MKLSTSFINHIFRNNFIFPSDNDVAENYVCTLCAKHFFTSGIITLAAFVYVNIPLLKKISYVHVA
jgi:hypothetical protein